jgi:hypothetical protein
LSAVGGTKCREGFFDESPALGANDGDACGCHDPLEGIVAATLFILVLRVKAPDLDLDDDGALEHRYLLGGIVVELWLLIRLKRIYNF